MANIPKGRIALYVVLGIVVIVLAVWVLRTRGEESKRTAGKRYQPAQVMKDAGHFKNRLDRWSSKAAGKAGADDLAARIQTAIADFETHYNETDDNPNEELTAKGRAIDKMLDSLQDIAKQ